MFTHTKPPAGTQINPLHPLSQGLVSCWLFNEGAGSLANDISGNKNHGRLTNMAPNVQGSGWNGSKFGSGLEFDGVDDYVNVSADESLDVNSISIEAWIKLNGDYSTDAIIVDKLDYANKDGYSLFFANGAFDNEFTFFTCNGASCGVLRSTISISDNDWHHIVAVSGVSGRNIYFDGILDETAGYYNIAFTTTNLNIGGARGDIFNGSIDNVRIYNRALSAEEIAWSYREPYAMFEPAFNPALLYSAAPPVGAIMNQFQKANIGADLYNGVFA